MLVAVIDSVKSSALPAGGVMVSAAKVQAEISTLASPGVAVKLLVPSLRVAPTGMAEISTVKFSDPSVSTSAGSMLRAIAVS